MLIATSEALNGTAVCDWADQWSGPRVLVDLPGSNRTQKELRALEKDFIVVECLQPPRSSAWLLCEIMTRLRHVLARPEWPLVFTTDALGTQELARLARAGTEEPWRIDHRPRDGGSELGFLLLGENITAHPLAPTFFACLRGAAVADSEFVELLDRNLAWGQE
ncbi:hypothetical protein [Acidimangrovimonas pyrenivorans]|uniref:Uncharacterized protein n=1 Tax=Acidimangrovimonas pyrenivorans TaxID=2030798 RepID=A0ABV7AMP1_9RHOB